MLLCAPRTKTDCVPYLSLETGDGDCGDCCGQRRLFFRSEAPGLDTSFAAAVGGRRPLPVLLVRRSDEPGAPPPAAAEVAQASRSHFRRTIVARTCSLRCRAACLAGKDQVLKGGN